MTKTICDICGNDIYDTEVILVGEEEKFPVIKGKYSFTYNGMSMDICSKCMFDFKDWIRGRRKESEG